MLHAGCSSMSGVNARNIRAVTSVAIMSNGRVMVTAWRGYSSASQRRGSTPARVFITQMLIQMRALGVAHLDAARGEVLLPSPRHQIGDLRTARQLFGETRLQPRVDDDRSAIRDVIPHDPALGRVDVGR